MKCPYCNVSSDGHKMLDPLRYIFTKRRIKMLCIACRKCFMVYADQKVNYRTTKTRYQAKIVGYKTTTINPSKIGGDLFEDIEIRIPIYDAK